ncbi:transcriptional regulator, IclR family [Beutenbergia cavernae DSM 12333]|uniref:Transcriptional regulator, IclR family n=1 Tax=Beutenbergia cavernae (strain ATCC BAA-8 / DSM 12333 / CCUG 43141 / JCM 11478 / NBRC 16432 / NCIMB 13614 / HKI 0122) TaxID=471853 RepID=C5C3K6_BEUC1|nr:IclR family transcriptional regulator [Beutenbergia cavernae]ACQ81915.1 transcriptional regulator, IclR family [Beutenbergia cavernae DSM 12333]
MPETRPAAPRRDTTSPTPRTAIQAIDRSVALLDTIADAGPHGAALGALAESTGLPASTARTLLSSLVAHGLVAQGGSGRRYLLGSRFFELNRRFVAQTDLSAVAAPVLRALWERTEETVHLAVLQGTRRVDIAVLVGPQLLTVSPTSARFTDSSATPLYRTAAGKVLFAGLSRPDRLSMLDDAPWDPQDRPAAEDLMAAMDDVAAGGFATNLQEEAAGVCGVAAPVQDQGGRTIAAVCLGYPAVRHTEAHAAWLRDEAMDAAAELTVLLGAATGEASA